MKERNRRNVPPVLRTGGILLPKNALVREHLRLPCVKGAGTAVSRKAVTEGL